MSKIVLQATDRLKAAIGAAFQKAMETSLLPKAEIPEFSLEVPADLSHGDMATNAAMVSAKIFHQPPRKIAQAITQNIDLTGTYFDRFEIAGPGFLNFFLGRQFYTDVLKDIQRCGKDYGRSDYGKKEKIMVEYVSANPTGPMHMGNARGGALGDCLASVLDAAGFDVYREFYVNDAGNQIEKFGNSLSLSGTFRFTREKTPSNFRRTTTTGTISGNALRNLPTSTATAMWTPRPRSAKRPWRISPCPAILPK